MNASVCRVCLAEGSKCVDIFAVYKGEFYLCEIIHRCTGVEVTGDAELSTEICVECAEELLKIELFCRKLIESERRLWEKLNEQPVGIGNGAVLEIENVILKEEVYNSPSSVNFVEDAEPIFDDSDTSKPEANANESEEFKCDQCAKVFKSSASLRTHNHIHNQGQFECSMCPKVLTNAGFLRIHMQRAHQVFEPKVKRERRQNETTNTGECVCEICDNRFNETDIAKHMRVHQTEAKHSTTNASKVIKCPLCLLTFSCRKNVQRHVKNVHTGAKSNQPAMYSCDTCAESFQLAVQLYEHQKTHDETCLETVEGFDLKCEECSQLCNSYETYARHMTLSHQHSKVKPYKCRLCSTRHGTRVALYMHINCHYDSSSQGGIKQKGPPKKVILQRFLCAICGNDFCTKQILKHHMLIHTGEKPYTCPHCGKSFRGRSALKEHIRTHTDERPYRCLSCEKAFRSHTNLRNHRIAAHSDLKKFQCNVCGKAFKFNASLRTHLWIHSGGEKPYKCLKCDLGFMRLKKQKEHSAICESGDAEATKQSAELPPKPPE